MGNKILALFLGLYLGFTFLLAAAAVLALQQLSQGADNTGRYAILRRLGAEERLVARSATQQVALAFLLPLGPVSYTHLDVYKRQFEHSTPVQICIVPSVFEKINCFFHFFQIFWIERNVPQRLGAQRNHPHKI